MKRTINCAAIFSLVASLCYSQSPYVGVWQGTTNQNLPVYFRVNADGVVDSIAVGMRVSFPGTSCVKTFTTSSRPPVQNGSFETKVFNSDIWTASGNPDPPDPLVKGTLASSGSGSGTIGAFSAAGGLCGGLVLGTGTSQSSKTWTVTRTSTSVPPPPPPPSFGPAVNTNGGFEGTSPGTKIGSDISGWTLYTSNNSPIATFEVVSNPVVEGSRALGITVTQLGVNPWSIQIVSEPVPVVPNTAYRYSAWVKADKINAWAALSVEKQSFEQIDYGYYQTSDTAWHKIYIDFTNTNETVLRAPIWLSDPDNSAILPVKFYIDDVRIQPHVVTDVVSEQQQVPKDFWLAQNYPNPFNPRSVIEYALPREQFVRLSVFNMLGQEVALLVNERRPAGRHMALFEAGDLPSGVYYYRLDAGGFTEVKKLVLLK